MQLSIIFWYVAVPKRTKFVYSEKTQLQEVLFWESSKFRFPKRLWERHRSSRNRSLEWRSRFKKQHGETKQNFTKRTQLAAPCRRRHQREGMSTRGWQGKLKAGQRFKQTAQSWSVGKITEDHKTHSSPEGSFGRTSVTCCPDIGTDSLTVCTAYDKVNSAVDCITVKFLKYLSKLST